MNTDFQKGDASAPANRAGPVFIGSGFAALLRPGMTDLDGTIYRLKP